MTGFIRECSTIFKVKQEDKKSFLNDRNSGLSVKRESFMDSTSLFSVYDFWFLIEKTNDQKGR